MLCLFIIFLSFALQKGWLERGKLRVTFLDVGQGSSILVRFPDGKSMIVDGGGLTGSGFDVGEMVVAPYLWHEGISKIDWMLLTHAHPDHFKGLKFIAEEFKPDVFYWNGVEPGEDEAELLDWAAFKKVAVARKVVIPEACHPCEGGDLVDAIKSVRHPYVQFLSPPSQIPSHWTLNDTSIATKITFGDFSFLLTGDIEAEAEDFVTKQLQVTPARRYFGGSHDSRLTVLQVPHHGSSTSTTQGLLDAVRPSFAVIQAGENNRYGFPRADVLERLNKIGTKIYRTDQDGAVEFVVGPAGMTSP